MWAVRITLSLRCLVLAHGWASILLQQGALLGCLPPSTAPAHPAQDEEQALDAAGWPVRQELMAPLFPGPPTAVLQLLTTATAEHAGLQQLPNLLLVMLGPDLWAATTTHVSSNALIQKLEECTAGIRPLEHLLGCSFDGPMVGGSFVRARSHVQHLAPLQLQHGHSALRDGILPIILHTVQPVPRQGYTRAALVGEKDEPRPSDAALITAYVPSWQLPDATVDTQRDLKAPGTIVVLNASSIPHITGEGVLLLGVVSALPSAERGKGPRGQEMVQAQAGPSLQLVVEALQEFLVGLPGLCLPLRLLPLLLLSRQGQLEHVAQGLQDGLLALLLTLGRCARVVVPVRQHLSKTHVYADGFDFWRF